MNTGLRDWLQWKRDHATKRMTEVNSFGRHHIPLDSQLNGYLQGERDCAIDALKQLHPAPPQKRITAWGTRAFGPAQMNNPAIRALRLLEEAIEFAQAVDVPQEQCARLVEYVYSRPRGTPPQELGGVGVCFNAAASSIGESADELVEREISRCESKPLEHFAARNQVKLNAGFDGQ